MAPIVGARYAPIHHIHLRNRQTANLNDKLRQLGWPQFGVRTGNKGYPQAHTKLSAVIIPANTKVTAVSKDLHPACVDWWPVHQGCPVLFLKEDYTEEILRRARAGENTWPDPRTFLHANHGDLVRHLEQVKLARPVPGVKSKVADRKASRQLSLGAFTAVPPSPAFVDIAPPASPGTTSTSSTPKTPAQLAMPPPAGCTAALAPDPVFVVNFDINIYWSRRACRHACRRACCLFGALKLNITECAFAVLLERKV
ncbi:hypothetical protein Rhopal_003998-T1 [Rhodotorula paludigena]|uniref:Uncharacterized protein n=1 Tax=Rhodotorula paludigena TaxID=86838 RepID=A0AAV5GKH9_9BASI|nr:hypothetical protein Rhopal_003998-T1 [Rhodotorula paludigena]